MSNQDNHELWLQAVEKYKRNLSTEDRAVFAKQKPEDIKKIITALSQPPPGKTGKLQDTKAALSPDATANIKNMTQLFSTFTSWLPEVSTTIWISVHLLNERKNVNSETLRIFDETAECLSSSVPDFGAFQEVFADMNDVESGIVEFYSRVITFLLAALDQTKQSSRRTHKLGIEAAPIALSKAGAAIQDQKQRASFAISGLGGVGKTQIALKFAYDNLDRYPIVLWIQADNKQKLAEFYANAAKRLHTEPDDSQKDVDAVSTVLKTWLSESDVEWLLVFDKADDLNVLKPFWPPANRGAIIITSRNTAGTRVADSGILISPLSSVEGETLFITLLTSRGSIIHSSDTHNKDKISEIVKELGYLPLEIVQVSSFILDCDCTVEEFQELYHSSHQANKGISDMETTSPNLFHEYSLATVWRVSTVMLSKNALKLLRLMSYFDPDGVPESLFWDAGKKSKVKALSFLQPGFAYDTAVQELISRSLITKAEYGAVAGQAGTKARSLTVHRLVQETVFHQLTEEEQADLLDEALTMLLTVWPMNKENPFRMNAFWPLCSLYLPHVLALEARCRDASYLDPPSGFVQLFFHASWYLFERRLSEFAFPLLETVRSICAQNGDTDPWFPKLMTAYGCVCLEADKLEESADWFSKVVTIYRANYEREQKEAAQAESEHTWLLAISLSDWGCACTGMGQYGRAEELFKEGLSAMKGVSNKHTYKEWSVHISHNLSRLYTHMGIPEESIKLQFEYGDEFADGLIVENTQRGALFLYGIGNSYLGLALKDNTESAQNRDRGFEFHRRALRIRQQVCGEQFVTAISLHKIGMLLYQTGDFEGACETLEHAIGIFKQSFMATREKARSLFYMSLVKEKMGEDAEAKTLLDDAWDYMTEATGMKRDAKNEKDTGLFDNAVLYVYY
ncbi:hypothetical protein FPSE_04065 [Fusarium pseudograminearum CS3096]|uniref:Uncharacterized protein n=1 Tax=Fusarium pseudograminearum (strain CS3096) TaxID=1028729 RepID=K3W1H0_FUSPC|nr:hypothetical protein FPSE_04065 [Fusarium pseudograminearum CS3096]EKJ75885.1 hypothetical protein FPSE_04065 [Fusarium pseudograminearum CS3096]